MEAQRGLLKSLLRNQLDRVKLLSNLKKHKVIFDEESPHVILKHKLQLKLIDNISTCADDSETLNLARLRKETEDILTFNKEKLAKVMFKCCLAGCLYECHRHREYMRHIQRVHPQESNIRCQFGLTCKRAFTSLNVLKDHISHAHAPSRSSSREDPIHTVETPCKCSIAMCGGAQFSSVKILMLHLRNYHAKVGEMIGCIC